GADRSAVPADTIAGVGRDQVVRGPRPYAGGGDGAGRGGAAAGEGARAPQSPRVGGDPLHPRGRGRADGRRRRAVPGARGRCHLHPHGDLPLHDQYRLGTVAAAGDLQPRRSRGGLARVARFPRGATWAESWLGAIV
ncbi:MAG: hypothetical protein AVDCRST_MAG18-4862, partial [uncultured Thermomicrobiales bacterium]